MLQPYGRILACTTHQKTCTIIYHTLSYFRDHQVSIAIIKSHVSFHHISRIILFHVSANIPVPHVFIFFMHQISFIVCQILFPYVTSSYIIVIFMRNHTSDIIFNHLCYMLIETIYLTYHTWFFQNHKSYVMCHASEFICKSALHLSLIYLLEYLKFVHALACSIYHTLFISDHLLTLSNPINMCSDFIHHVSNTKFNPSFIPHHAWYRLSYISKHHTS